MPAMPLPNGADDRPYTLMDGEKFQERHAMGLTKREQFAAMAMQGLISHDVTDYDEMASDAVMAANALLAQLEKSK